MFPSHDPSGNTYYALSTPTVASELCDSYNNGTVLAENNFKCFNTLCGKTYQDTDYCQVVHNVPNADLPMVVAIRDSTGSTLCPTACGGNQTPNC